MTGFVTRPDIEQGGIYDILAEYGALTGTSLPAALNTALPDALNTALPPILPPIISPIIQPILDARGIYRPITEAQFPKLAGETDDTGMVQRAFNWARDNRTSVVGIPNRRYVLSDAITIAPIYCGLLGQGAGFIQTVAGKNGFNINNTPSGDDTGVNHAFKDHSHRLFDGFVLYGPGRAANGSIAMNFMNPSAGFDASNYKIDEWDAAYDWDDKSYIQHHDRFSVTHCNRMGAFRGTTGWDAGERLSWTNGTFSNSNGGFYFNRCQAYFHNCSYDYIISTSAVNPDWFEAVGADLFFTQCHIEGNQTTNYWGTARAGGSINFDSCTLIATGAPQGAATRSTPLFFSDTGTRSSVNFLGVNKIGQTGPTASNGFGTMPAFVDGPGRCDKLVSYNPTTAIPPSHTGNNLFIDGTFTTAALRDWRDTSTAAALSGTSAAGEAINANTRKFAPASGVIGRQEMLLRISDPNAQIFLAGNMLATGTPTEPFTIGFEFHSRTGEAINTGNFVVSAATLASTYATASFFRAQPSIVTPRGAAYCRITMNKGAFDAASNGVGAVMVDDLILNAPGCQVVASGEPAYPGWNVRQVSASNTPINVDDTVFVDTSGGPVSLPAPGGVIRAGSRMRYGDKAGTWGTNAFTWTPGSQGVRGSTAAVVHNTNWQSITYEYNGTTWNQV